MGISKINPEFKEKDVNLHLIRMFIGSPSKYIYFGWSDARLVKEGKLFYSILREFSSPIIT